MLSQFTDGLPQIEAIPKAAVKDSRKFCVPGAGEFFSPSIFSDRFKCLVIALDNGSDILVTPGSALNFENPHTRFNHSIQKTNRFEVFRTHDVLVVDFKLDIALLIFGNVGATARLNAAAAVGTVASRA